MADYKADEHWSEVADKASRRGRRGRLVAGDDAPYYRYKRRLFVEKFLAQIPTGGTSVLEVGCGPGGNLAELLERQPRRLVGCDVAPGMVETARETYGARGVEVVLIDGTTLPFGDREFDVSFTATVLMHNPEPTMEQIVAEMCRITGSSVYLIEDTFPSAPAAATPSPKAGVEAAADDAETGIGDYGSFFSRSPGQYADVCAKHGFVLKDTQFLQTFVSHAMFTLLKTRLDKGRTSEGEGFSRLHWGLETTLQPVTRQLDRVVRRPAGELTLMRFDRM
jgi:SAM-dependent methyltransferase